MTVFTLNVKFVIYTTEMSHIKNPLPVLKTLFTVFYAPFFIDFCVLTKYISIFSVCWYGTQWRPLLVRQVDRHSTPWMPVYSSLVCCYVTL